MASSAAASSSALALPASEPDSTANTERQPDRSDGLVADGAFLADRAGGSSPKRGRCPAESPRAFQYPREEREDWHHERRVLCIDEPLLKVRHDNEFLQAHPDFGGCIYSELLAPPNGPRELVQWVIELAQRLYGVATDTNPVLSWCYMTARQPVEAILQVNLRGGPRRRCAPRRSGLITPHSATPQALTGGTATSRRRSGARTRPGRA